MNVGVAAGLHQLLFGLLPIFGIPATSPTMNVRKLPISKHLMLKMF
jgi:hypothetical protein